MESALLQSGKIAGVEAPPSTNPDCLICRKQRREFAVPGGPIFVDETLYAWHAHLQNDETQVYLGWLILETRRHVLGLADLSDGEAGAVGRMAARLSRALIAATGAEHIYAFVLGHHVSHFHLHLLPRYPGTPREFWGMRVDEWPDAPKGGEAEVADLVKRLQQALQAQPVDTSAGAKASGAPAAQ
jgi:diadenosine tetraphosphate (Ap4A) HIT family hydrolase